MSEKGQARKSMFSVPNMEELASFYESDTPVLAYDFKRRMVEGWTPEHSHHRGQLVALTQEISGSGRRSKRFQGIFPTSSNHTNQSSMLLRKGEGERRDSSCGIT